MKLYFAKNIYVYKNISLLSCDNQTSILIMPFYRWKKKRMLMESKGFAQEISLVSDLLTPYVVCFKDISALSLKAE